MLRARQSNQVKGNAAVQNLRKTRGESNQKWILRANKALDPDAPKLLLLGGTDITDFRVRIAQSDARRDMKPSFWSHVMVYVPGRRSTSPALWHAPLEVGDDISAVPRTNGVIKSTLTYCANKSRWKNLALLEFHGVTKTQIGKDAKRIQSARLSLDLVSPLVEWLGFVWGVGATGNPLLAGVPLPAASFAEAVFANSDIDLAPGMADRTHCPEAIWQGAKWWSDFYGGDEEAAAPRGRFVIGQGAAAVR